MDYLDKALEGDQSALEKIIEESRNMVFNMSLRMLGTIHDAEDATQEILIKVMTNLSSFQRQSQFSTWVYRLTVNYLLDYKKSRFYKQALNFEIFGEDLKLGCVSSAEIVVLESEEKHLMEELKLSCTNVMLQCFNPEERIIFILGTMFKCHSKLAGEILNISAVTYRKRLSRLRSKMCSFLEQHCGLQSGKCSCSQRIPYAVSKGRLDEMNLPYSKLDKVDRDKLLSYKDEMEVLEDQILFDNMYFYKATEVSRNLLNDLLNSSSMGKLLN